MKLGPLLLGALTFLVGIVLAFGAIWGIAHNQDITGYCVSFVFLIIIVGMVVLMRN